MSTLYTRHERTYARPLPARIVHRVHTGELGKHRSLRIISRQCVWEKRMYVGLIGMTDQTKKEQPRGITSLRYSPPLDFEREMVHPPIPKSLSDYGSDLESLSFEIPTPRQTQLVPGNRARQRSATLCRNVTQCLVDDA